MTVHVITFHSTKSTWHETPHPYGGLRRPHTELIALFLESIRTWEPDGIVTLLTDAESSISGGFDNVLRCDFLQSELMLARLRMQRTAIEVLGKQRGLIALLDTDTLLIAKLSDVFDGTFDVGITVRDRPVEAFEVAMPYNNGVILVDCRERLSAVLEYFDELISRVEAMEKDLHAWSGNQFAVKELVGVHAAGATISIGRTRIRVFPCSTYNYTPRSPTENVSGKKVLHFKGEYKHLMAQYAQTVPRKRDGESG